MVLGVPTGQPPESRGPTRWRILGQRSQSFWAVFRRQGILQDPQGGLGSARPSGQPRAGRGWMLPRPLHRPPARASRGALSQAGTLIKTGATPPSPVTPRYPHKLHFICFLFTVSLLIKSVITCLRGRGPRFPTSRDRRACSRGSGRAHVGPRSRLFPGGARSACTADLGVCVCTRWGHDWQRPPRQAGAFPWLLT